MDTKRIGSFLLLLFMALSVLAIPAKRGIYKVIKLADGTEVRAELRGDEHANCWFADNGKQYVFDEKAKCYVIADMSVLEKKSPFRKMNKSDRSVVRKTVGVKPTDPIVGNRKGIVVLVQFKDVSFEEGHNLDFYKDVINKRNFTNDAGYVGSVRDYFYDQSGGKLDYEFDVFGPVTLPENQAYYGGNTANNNSKNMRSLIKSTLSSIKDEVDFSKYDNDSDGFVDNIFFLYAGKNEADGGGEETIWPHMYYYYSGFGVSFSQNGVYVDTYACSSELRSDGRPGGIGVICHEFSHCLGLPDMYDTGDVGNYGNSYWDVMHVGCYNGDLFRPCAFNAYEREFCGWGSLVELADDTTVDSLSGVSDGGKGYVIYNDGYSKECFIIENRTLSNWDSALPGNGLLIYHVDYDYMAWHNNSVNNEEGHQRMAIVAADNKYDSGSIATDVFPAGGSNMFCDITSPASTLFNTNTDGTYNLNKMLYDIVKNDDGTVNFKFKNSGFQLDNQPPEGNLFYEGFGISIGTGGNDGRFSGFVATADFGADNEGWSATDKFGGFSCARFGTNLKNGIAVTPKFTISGKAKLTFKVAPYASECARIKVTVASGSAALDTDIVNLSKGIWTEAGIVITGEGEISLKFGATKRWFLDEVIVMPYSDETGIGDIMIDDVYSATPVYNISGQRVGDDYKGIVIKDGRKYLRK